MNPEIKMALAGGGDARDSRLLDEVFAGWLGPAGSLLYLPLALRGVGSFQAGYEWVLNTFAPLGVKNITMWTEFSGHSGDDLDPFDGIYIGGGNTFSLMAQLIESGFDAHIKSYVNSGNVVYGGSAGAIVLGRDIRTARHLDPNDVNLEQTGCLDLADGWTIWPHYVPQDDPLIFAYNQFYTEPVLALSERSGVVLDETGLHSMGYYPVYKFDSHGKTRLT
jgi:dipeptidase E